MDQLGTIGGSAQPPDDRAFRFGLSLKLLILTIAFVMLAEILIFVPSIANFQRYEVENGIRSASVAAHSLTGYPPGIEPPRAVQEAILRELEAYAIAVRANGMKQLVAMTEMPPPVTREVNVETMGFHQLVVSAFDTLLFGSNRTIRAVGSYGGGDIEVVFPEKALRARMLEFSGRIFLTSIIISTFTAVLVYFSIRHLFIRPMKRLGSMVAAWSHDPESVQHLVPHSGRTDEIGQAEIAMSSMQQRVQELFKQQRRLAELGLAVSKINHDLRNLLASAQLISDRLTLVQDPTVQRFAPKLVGAIDRAITYCQSVLAYGRAQEPPPARRLVALSRLTDDVADMTGLTYQSSIEWVNAVPETLEVDADADQLFRVLLNLVRNAIQALEQSGGDAVVRRLIVSGERRGAMVRITVSDTGPGLPDKAREGLFKPFQGAVRRGGTGLGLTIAAELVRAHGGSIRALDNGPGAVFEIEIPDRPAAARA